MDRQDLISAARDLLIVVDNPKSLCPQEIEKIRIRFIKELEAEKERQLSRASKVCVNCGFYMLSANGCDTKYIAMDGSYYLRILVEEKGLTKEGRCHDCGAFLGKIHHMGCDMERCPICKKGQFITCDCIIGKEVSTVNVNEER